MYYNIILLNPKLITEAKISKALRDHFAWHRFELGVFSFNGSLSNFVLLRFGFLLTFLKHLDWKKKSILTKKIDLFWILNLKKKWGVVIMWISLNPVMCNVPPEEEKGRKHKMERVDEKSDDEPAAKLNKS